MYVYMYKYYNYIHDIVYMHVLVCLILKSLRTQLNLTGVECKYM